MLTACSPVSDMGESALMARQLMMCLDAVFCSFQFSPTANGMHTETWVLHTHPKTPQGPHQITLRGAAVGPNLLGRERRRVTAMLAEREKSSKVPLLGATVCFVAFMLVPDAVVVKSQHLMHLLILPLPFGQPGISPGFSLS